MKEELSQTTKPGETYIRLGHMIKHMAPGDKMTPFARLLKELRITQRSLDIAYTKLASEGVLDIRKQSGVFIKNPYAGGTFLFVAAENIFLNYGNGEYIRLYLYELRRQMHRYFPGCNLEIALAESPDMHHNHDEREPQLRRFLNTEHQRKRILGAFITYTIVEPQTTNTLTALNIPFVDLDGETLKIVDAPGDVATMVAHLQKLGHRKINIVTNYNHQDINEIIRSDPDLSGYFVSDADAFRATEAGIEYIKKLINTRVMPEAFAVYDDYFCQGMLMGAYMCGVKLEEQYGLITASQKGVPIYSNTPITRLDLCWNNVADTALEILRKQLRREDISKPVRVRRQLSC